MIAANVYIRTIKSTMIFVIQNNGTIKHIMQVTIIFAGQNIKDYETYNECDRLSYKKYQTFNDFAIQNIKAMKLTIANRPIRYTKPAMSVH